MNDRLVEIDKAAVPATDGGLLYGAGLFETMRSCDGVVFALDDHLDRLFAGIQALSITDSYDRNYITDAINKTLKDNKLTDARLRLTLTSGPMVQDPEQERKATLLITATEFTPYPAEYYSKGVMVVICPFRQNPTDPVAGHKTTNYLSRMLALNEARKKGAAEALWFTVDNRLAEACISNVFLVKDSVLYTPSLETPVLAGVARKAVCQLAADNSIELIEKDLYIDDVLEADELFLTNVIMQIMPITTVEKHTIADGKIGEMTKKLTEKFNEFVKNQCRKKK